MDLEGQLSERQEAGMVFDEAGAMARISALEAEVEALRRELKEKDEVISKAADEKNRMIDSDPLTGLANRRYFMEMLTKGVSFARRSNLPLSVVMCDLDNFKFIIDTYGHDTADRIMVMFAEIFNRFTRTEDVVARVGNDEFMIMLPNTLPEHAITCAERMSDTMKKLTVEGVAARLSASFGVTAFKDTDSEESLVKRVDDALFKAKGGGINKVAAI